MTTTSTRRLLGALLTALCLLLVDTAGTAGPLRASSATATAASPVAAKASKRTTRIPRWPAGTVAKGSALSPVRITGPTKRRVKVQRRVAKRWKTIRVVRTSKTGTAQVSFITKRPGTWRLRVPAKGKWSRKTTRRLRVTTAAQEVRLPDQAVGSWWSPAKGTSWQWQLTGTIDTSVDAAVFDVDGEDVSAATVSALHAKGAKVICYFSAGACENCRSDASSFPSSVKGKALDGWADEKLAGRPRPRRPPADHGEARPTAPPRASTPSSPTSSTASPTTPDSR